MSRARLSAKLPSEVDTDVSTVDIDKCLRGEKLFGDDFSPAEVDAWFKDEEDGYYNLTVRDRSRYVYAYVALNQFHGYSALPDHCFRHVLGLGSAYGDELQPVARKASKITVLESSQEFRVEAIEGTPVEYVKPNPTGLMPFNPGEFDLITCFSVLHHIPNVSTLIGEMHRCLAVGGYALVREPIVSMGDWRMPRKGLTKRERGIPLNILRDRIVSAGFDIVRERRCVFPAIRYLQYLKKTPVFNSRFWTLADSLICGLPIWPNVYHPTNQLARLRPNAVFLVLRKPVLD